MSISDQINLVEREFVAAHILVEALMIQEKVTEFHVASWFLRNIEELYSLQMIEFNRELKDFTIAEDCWASDIFSTIVVDKVPSPEWTNLAGGYIGGWLSSELKQFFSKSSLDYPEALIADLSKSEFSSCDKAKSDFPATRTDTNTDTDTVEHSEIDPADYPPELDAANMAFRAITNGYGDQSATPRNKIIAYLEMHYSHFKQEQVQRIATIANPDKSTGRKKSNMK